MGSTEDGDGEQDQKKLLIDFQNQTAIDLCKSSVLAGQAWRTIAPDHDLPLRIPYIT